MIKKYFSPDSSEADQEKWSNQLKENVAELDSFFSESEWNELPSGKLEPNSKSEAFLAGIVEEKGAGTTTVLRLRKWLAAASVLLAIGLGIVYLFRAEKKSSTAPAVAIVTPVPESKNALHLITQKNDQRSAMHLRLPDGSAVLLSPHSGISYLPSLNADKRDIYLEGEAFFEVAKDAGRPFSVYCKEVQTTALGTKFRVSALKDSVHVSVVLLEGKVLVKSTATAYNGSKYYLLPGNEIDYNRTNSRFTLNTNDMAVATVSKITVASPETKEEEITTDTHIQINAEKKLIRFNDVGMAKVLDIIARKYGVSIAYPTGRISEIRFVGTLNEHDAVKKILTDITLMNNLQLIADSAGKKYTIR